MLTSSITLILAAVATHFNVATAAPTELEARQLLTVVTGFDGTACNGTLVLTSTGIISPGLCYTTSAGDINSYRVIATGLLTTCTARSYASTDCSGTQLSSGSPTIGQCIANPSAGHSIRVTC